MNFFDWYSASYGLLTVALFEVLVIMQVYGKSFCCNASLKCIK